MLTFAIGDIHGCYNQLVELVDKCRGYALGYPCKFVFLGDYIDRGPKSCEVIKYLINLQQDHPDSVFLMGNHENLLLDYYKGGELRNSWFPNGGFETLHSYFPNYSRNELIINSVNLFVPPEHIKWMSQLSLYHEDEHRIYVHAGLNPDVDGLENQRKFDLLWIRNSFLMSNKDFGKLIVHGHTPSKIIQVHPNRINLDTSCVFGGMLTAAVFSKDIRNPIEYIQV